MIQLFLGLMLANFAGLVTTIAMGYWTVSRPTKGNMHMLVGSMATILCVAVHCVVFTYFIATAKWVRHAVLVKKLDAALADPTRSFKAQAFPFALLSMLSVFFAAVMGAAVSNYAISRQWHHVTAWVMLGINMAAAYAEYGAIRRNQKLIDKVLELANARAAM